jgi:hypothetical protein
MVKESEREREISKHKGETVQVKKSEDVEESVTSTTASELKQVDSYNVASGERLTEVETGKLLPGNEPETTSVQTEKKLDQDQEKKKGKAKRDIHSITGKYTRIQPMTSIRRIESFDVADDANGTNKTKLSYEQVVANLEEGQIYTVIDDNKDSARLKVVQTPWGKVITTEKDNSEVNNINGPQLEEYPLDADTQTAMEAEQKAKAKKDREEAAEKEKEKSKK